MPSEEDPTKLAHESFPYSAIALTKCVTYKVNRADFDKIPQNIKD